jgi:hypothetical protein
MPENTSKKKPPSCLLTLNEAFALLEERLANAKTKKEKDRIYKKIEEIYEMIITDDK